MSVINHAWYAIPRNNVKDRMQKLMSSMCHSRHQGSQEILMSFYSELKLRLPHCRKEYWELLILQEVCSLQSLSFDSTH